MHCYGLLKRYAISSALDHYSTLQLEKPSLDLHSLLQHIVVGKNNSTPEMYMYYVYIQVRT